MPGPLINKLQAIMPHNATNREDELMIAGTGTWVYSVKEMYKVLDYGT